MAAMLREAGLVWAVFSVCILTVSSASVEQNGFTIKETDKKPSVSKLTILHSPSYVTFLPSAGPIRADEISSILSLGMGFSSSKELSWAGLLSGNVFQRPEANVLITVDGLTGGDTFHVPQESTSYGVSEVEDPPSLPTIMTVSKLNRENLASRISSSFRDKSFTFSLSGDAELAAAGFSAARNSHTFYWSREDDRFTAVQQQASSRLFANMSFTKDQLLKRFEERNFGDGVKYSAAEKVFSVSVPEKGDAHFNMENVEDFLVFAEVDAILQLLTKLSAGSNLVNDGTPDVFTLSLSALKGLRRRYGDESRQLRGALKFLEGIIPQIVAQFVELYHGNVLVEGLTLAWHGTFHERFPQEVRVVYEASQAHLLDRSQDAFIGQLPSVILRENLDEADKEALCKSLDSRLLAMNSGLNVDCFVGSRSRERRAVEMFSLQANKTSFNSAPQYSEDYPAIFNVCLWLLVFLVLSTYVIALVMWYMDPGRDSIIYRMTSQRIKTE